MDFEIQEWSRDRKKNTKEKVRAYRYKRPGIFSDFEPYSVDTKYLLLMRKPFDEGAGQNKHWLIIIQYYLDASPFCLQNENRFQVIKSRDGCNLEVEEAKFLDGIRSFDECFQLSENPRTSPIPVRKLCSDEEIEIWSKRSEFHSILAEKAIDLLSNNVQ